MGSPAKVSIVVLTYNREEELIKTINNLSNLKYEGLEIIVVDNASKEPAKIILDNFCNVKVITLDENIGVGARNIGISEASGKYVITLDDDVRGLKDEDILVLIDSFEKDESIAAINFKVLEEGTGKQINWCHHRKVEEWGDREFDTFEISEGAVAFRREVVINAGLYPDYYFISHEGPDLAIRLMNNGYIVSYNPKVIVEHAQSLTARVSWRRYYYDTRNLIWFIFKYFGFRVGVKKLVIGLGALFVYSVRDGYIKYWFKGVFDSLKVLKKVKEDKVQINKKTWRRYKEIESFSPSFLYQLKKRLFNKNVSI